MKWSIVSILGYCDAFLSFKRFGGSRSLGFPFVLLFVCPLGDAGAQGLLLLSLLKGFFRDSIPTIAKTEVT